MKNITGIVLVAAVISCARASDFSDGVEDGEWYCEDKWDEWSGDCDDSWGVEDVCDALIDDYYAIESGDSPSIRSYKRGGRKGVKKAIRQIEKRCLHDIRQCNDLGKNAAEEIAFDLCDSRRRSFRGSRSKPRYKDECRGEGIDICEGNIVDEFYEICKGESLGRQELNDAKKKCGRTVNRLLDWKRPGSGPVARPDNFSMQASDSLAFFPVLDNDTPSPGESLMIKSITQNANNGDCSIGLDLLEVAYSPNDGFTGQDSCVYQACDLECDEATLTINVTSNCPPASFVGCTAPNMLDPQDECPTVGQPCANGHPGEFCCRDACPRNYCTAKELPARK